MLEAGISIYFKQNKIRIRQGTMEHLGYPEHIHIKVNEEKKQLFIEKCEPDMNSFRIEYLKKIDVNIDHNDDAQPLKSVRERSCYIHAKKLVRYMARVLQIPVDSPSLRFIGQTMPDGQVFIDLGQYTVVSYVKDGKHSSRNEDAVSSSESAEVTTKV